MYNGYLAVGVEDYFDAKFELVNTGRVQAYIENWNKRIRQRALAPAFRGADEQCIDWYENCDECETADAIFTNGAGYILPEADPAPWYSPTVRDSEKFFGVVGLEITGAEDSTRTATVQRAVAGGGAVSRLRFGPRSIVVRGLAIAADSCGMEVGLNWLRCQYETTIEDCGNDYLWFLDCCPTCASDPNSPPVGPCWPDDYAQLESPWTIDCDGAWTPSTYAELKAGPPNLVDYGWCAWIEIYRDLTNGLPEFACDLNNCLVPYIRNFQQARVIEGPTILSRQSLTVGEIAEIEFTIACGDPHEYTPANVVFAADVLPPGEAWNDVTPPAPVLNPFFPPEPARSPGTGIPMPTEWMRTEVPFEPARTTSLSTVVPSVLIQAESEGSGVVRVGVWDEDELVGGFAVPFVPGGGLVKVDAIRREVLTEYDGQVRTYNGFARNFQGRAVQNIGDLQAGKAYKLTFDQPADAVVPLVVEVLAAGKGCA